MDGFRQKCEGVLLLLALAGVSAAVPYGVMPLYRSVSSGNPPPHRPLPEDSLSDLPPGESREIATHAILAIAQRFQFHTVYLVDRTRLSLESTEIEPLLDSVQGRGLLADGGLVYDLPVCNARVRRLHDDDRLHSMNRISPSEVARIFAERHVDYDTGSRTDCDYAIIGVSVPSVSADGNAAAVSYCVSYDCGNSGRYVMTMSRGDDGTWSVNCDVSLGIYCTSR